MWRCIRYPCHSDYSDRSCDKNRRNEETRLRKFQFLLGKLTKSEERSRVTISLPRQAQAGVAFLLCPVETRIDF